MKNFYYYFFTVMMVGSLFFIKPAFAEYLTYSGYAGVVDEAVDGCVTGDFGIGIYGIANDGAGTTGSGQCGFHVFFQVPEGKILSSIKLYYYDNSGSQYFSASLYKAAFSSRTISLLAGIYDRTTSSSVQTSTLSYGSALSSDSMYYVEIRLSYGTAYRGMRVFYY